MSRPWECPHGVGPDMERGDCVACNRELAQRPEPSAMTGDERAEEVRTLLNDPSAYRVADIQADGGKLTPDQEWVLDRLEQAGAEVACWRPADFPAVEAALR